MTNMGKKYNEIAKLVDKTKLYTAEEAFELVVKTKTAKFNETVEVALRLGVDPRHANQQIRGTVSLPNGTGKTVRIVEITQGDNEKKAQSAGADFVGGDDIIEKIKNGWSDFDLVIATPDMMPKLGKLGKILGTKGLMPNPKSGTVTTEIDKTVEEFKKGKVAFRVDKLGSIHVPMGKCDFTVEKLVENFKTYMAEITRLKPTESKGQYLRTVAISLTMGPGIKIDPLSMKAFLGM